MLASVVAVPLELSDVTVTRSPSKATNNESLAELEARAVPDARIYVGFSEYGCTGDAGDSIGYNDRCVYAGGSESFYISAACPTMFVGLYEHKKCEHGRDTYLTARPGSCHDVNTGYAWLGNSWTAAIIA